VAINDVSIPNDLLPIDGRFGSGPSLVRKSDLDALADLSEAYMGTSHRQSPVKDMVGRLRDGLSELFGLPDDWEIVLGNGGSTLFWDAATFSLISEKSHHLVFGEFSSKFATASKAAPHIGEPVVAEFEPGTGPVIEESGADTYAFTHNETSTGVSMDLQRPANTSADEAIVLVDATSAAGGMVWEPANVDCYYFAPQKCFASDGGLWIAACSPAAVQRINDISSRNRWTPAGLDLKIALENSRKNQTYNTPALATIFLTVRQIEWMNNNGGLSWAANRSKMSSDHIYNWVENHELAEPFVTDSSVRSPVVSTIDLSTRVNADQVIDICKANGILDIGGYRKLGRNQLRIATFPAIELSDIEALTASLDYVLETLL
tara:strand:- start:6663 stop:7790 length:1128 start_codon:yes stop_codon:yes gene_type:complete